MIEYVIMDYDGEPVTIEDGEMFYWEPDDGEHWNPQTCEFEPDDEDDEPKYYDDGPDPDYWWDSHPECHDYFIGCTEE